MEVFVWKYLNEYLNEYTCSLKLVKATAAAAASHPSLKSDILTFSHIHFGGIKEVTKLYSRQLFSSLME